MYVYIIVRSSERSARYGAALQSRARGRSSSWRPDQSSAALAARIVDRPIPPSLLRARAQDEDVYVSCRPGTLSCACHMPVAQQQPTTTIEGLSVRTRHQARQEISALPRSVGLQFDDDSVDRDVDVDRPAVRLSPALIAFGQYRW